MIKSVLFTAIVSLSSQAFGVHLLQETQDIKCSTKGVFGLTIDHRDRFIKTHDGLKYNAVEFLDSAILLKRKSRYALIQLTSENEALFIEGLLYNFREQNCKRPKGSAPKAHKDCKNSDGVKLFWSPETLALQGNVMNVSEYGVYPNDGTYFIAERKEGATALIDFGSRFKVLKGSLKKLTCKYK